MRSWDIYSNQQVAITSNEDKSLNAAGAGTGTVSPNGKYVAEIQNQTVTVWDKNAGSKEVARMHHNSLIRAVTFSPDSQYLGTASEDNTAKIWLWQPDNLMSEACKRLTRNLTQEEFQEYLPNESYHKTCPNLP